MTNYTTGTSDKKKKTATLLCFVFGILGFHKFYVGLIKQGLLFFFIGIIVISSCVTAISLSFSEPNVPVGGAIGLLIIWYIIAALIDGIKILLGAFRDNVGAPLRH